MTVPLENYIAKNAPELNIVRLTLPGTDIPGRQVRLKVDDLEGNWRYLTANGTWTDKEEESWVTDNQGHFSRVLTVLRDLLNPNFTYSVESRESSKDNWVETVRKSPNE